MKLIRGRTIFLLAILFALMGIVIAYLLVGRYLTGRFRADIKPRIEAATGLEVDLKSIALNPFPFFAQVKGLTMAVPGADTGLDIAKVRAYFDFMALIKSREVRIEHLQLDGVRVHGDITKAGAMLNIPVWPGEGEPLPGEADGKFPYQLALEEAMISGMEVDVFDPARKLSLKSEALSFAVYGGKPHMVRIHSGNLMISYGDRISLPLRIAGGVRVWSAEELDLSDLSVEALESEIFMKGRVRGEEPGLQAKGRLLLSSLKRALGLKGPGKGALQVSGTVRPSLANFMESELDLKISGNGYIENLFEALRIEPVVAGPVSGDISVSGPLYDLELDGDVKVKNGRILELDEAYVDTHVNYRRSVLSFTNGHGKIIGGEADNVWVNLEFGKPLEYRVSCNVAGVDSVRLFHYIGWTPPHTPGGVTGYLKLDGRGGPEGGITLSGWAEYSSDGKGAGPAGKVIFASTGFSLAEGMLVLDPIILKTPAAEAFVTGRVDLNNRRLALDFSGRGNDISTLAGEYYAGLRGAFLAEGRVDGRFINPLVSGSLSINSGSVAGVAFDSAKGDLRLSTGQLGVENMIVKMDGAMLEGRGTVSFTGEEIFTFNEPLLNLSGNFQKLDANYALRLFGLEKEVFENAAITGELHLFGKPGGLVLDIGASSDGGKVFGQSYDHMGGGFRIKGREVAVTEFEMQRKMSALKADGTIGLDGGYCLTFAGTDIYLEDVDSIPEGISGSVSLDADCSPQSEDGIKRMKGSGVVEIRDLAYKKASFGNGRLQLNLMNDRLSFTGSILDGNAPVKGWVFLSGKPPWSLEVELKPLDYTYMASLFFHEIPNGVSLRTRGTLTAGSVGGELSLKARLDSFELLAGGRDFVSEKPIEFSLEDGVVRVKPFSIKQGTSYLEGGGQLFVGEKYDLFLGGRMGLDFLRMVAPGVEDARGDAWLVFDVTGEWGEPQLTGSGFIDRGSISLKDVPGRFSGVRGTFFLEGGNLMVDGLRADWSGGDLEISGTGRLEGFHLSDFHMEGRASGVSLRPVKDMFLRFDAQVVMDAQNGRKYLNGDLVFRKAVYRGRVDYRGWLGSVRRQEAVPRDRTWIGDTELNIHITGKEHILIENNIARAELTPDLYLVGTVAKPRLLGRLEADGGKFFFRSQEFSILSGSADFIDPARFNPIFNISADTWTQGYRIRLRLEGPMDGFDMSLDSDPYLEETDILALLTVGSLGSDLEGLEGGVGAAEAASFLAGDIQNTIEERMVYLTGVDRFQLDPHFNKALGSLGPRLTVGKRLFSDRLFVTYSSDVGTTEGQLVRLEYHLLKGLSLIGQSDETGNTGADVKIHFDFD